MEYSPKYGVTVHCLSTLGPCGKMCQVCIKHADDHFENDVREKAKECKRYLERAGFEVKATEFVPYEFLRNI